MVHKKWIKSRKVYQLSFEYPLAHLPGGVPVESLTVVGDFNGWDLDASPMSLVKSRKVYRAVVEISQKGSYNYRFLLNGVNWLNDWDAESYTTNPFGDDNCVVTVG